MKRYSNMTKIFLLLAIFAISIQMEIDEGNPFYVDPSTINKETYKWTMHLKNHRQGNTDTANPELTLAWTEIESLDENVLHLKINNKTGSRWEVPLLNPNPRKDYKPAPMEKMGFTFENDPFTFKIISPKTKEELINTHRSLLGTLKYFDRYIEVGFWYPNTRIFGMGERVTEDFQLCAKRAT
eukprot:TRINITY_DN17246_c0_g1_i1.p2 TRINITY_DN17246_c0_g1~~TRINITY_DN17246_c0_g1_i1.p2  ORF type:complete len:183 (+),score=31.21 TRINITY_DN17246_c0_g1_i1:43-591(+)